MKNALSPATAFHGATTLPFVIPSEAEGSAALRTFRGNVLRQGRSVAEGSAVSFPEPRTDTTPVLRC